jgi:hypothetical protein
MATTTDPHDHRIHKKLDSGQYEAYLVLPEESREGFFVRPIRLSYVHDVCQAETAMGYEVAETFACRPEFYSHTYCIACRKHFPVGEFTWKDTSEKVGS